jgi:REP element-mobilizing transposase RayT
MNESFRRRRLPHWDIDNATYFVTCCLAGSLPARGLLPVRRSKPPQRRALQSAGKRFAEWDALLDTQAAVAWLVDPALATIVQESILSGDGDRYRLSAYVVMPSHVHWVFTPLQRTHSNGVWPRSQILASFKRHTARACNRLLGRQGDFWQSESYDRVVRNGEELARTVGYIERNPVRAGLCREIHEYRFSSAFGGVG